MRSFVPGKCDDCSAIARSSLSRFGLEEKNKAWMVALFQHSIFPGFSNLYTVLMVVDLPEAMDDVVAGNPECLSFSVLRCFVFRMMIRSISASE